MHTIVAAVTVLCNTGGGGSCDTGLPQVTASSAALGSILQVVFGVIAALTVLIIVIGGFRFVEAQGDPQGVKKARGTIVYALVGLVVCVSAEIIVAFTLKKL